LSGADSGDPFPGSTSNSNINSLTNPSTNTYSYDRDADGTVEQGSTSGISISNIAENPDGLITLTVTNPNSKGEILGYDEGGYEGIAYDDSYSMLQWAGVRFEVSDTALLSGIETVFPPSFWSWDVTYYTLNVWEGWANNMPQNLLYSSNRNVNWNPDEYRDGGWAHISLLDETILWDTGETYYVEINFNGTGGVYPFDKGVYSNSANNNLSYFRGNTGETCRQLTEIADADWNIRAVLSYESYNIYGCTDELAENYNPDATLDDESCEYDCSHGDVNCDGELNVLDIVILVNMILEDEYDEIADINEDGGLNVLDVVILVNLILDGDDGACIDIDGNIYETIQIAEQVWMAENLKVTHYRNGDEISYPSNPFFGIYDEGQYGVYDNDPANADIYGNLYNWAVVDDDRGVCPDGFHVPSDEEFMELEMELGMSEEDAISEGFRGTDEGSQLAGNSDLWTSMYPAGALVNNSEFETSGFNGLPAGFRNANSGYYDYTGYNGYFWSSSDYDSTNAWTRRLSFDNSDVARPYLNKKRGFSIRCLGD